MPTPSVLTVSQLNRYLKYKFEEDANLSAVYLTGEISNFTNHYRSGHLYFSLKDEKATVRAVMFASQANRLRFVPEDGMKVLVRGRVGVYEASGQYQVYVEDLQPDGVGALNVAFEQLKAKLEQEGLFAPERKKPLPFLPQKIGVVTSPTGAAIQDILQILGRRYPMGEVVLLPVLVQGEQAAPQIVRAIQLCNQQKLCDVLIVGRGGGSLEDLWAFNEEKVARAVANSQIPVVSAVGHETDFTICDFVADLRAPTPSAAAELVAPDQLELLAMVQGYQNAMTRCIHTQLERYQQQLDTIAQRMRVQHPKKLLTTQKDQLQSIQLQLQNSIQTKVQQAKTTLVSLSSKLDGLSPLKQLARGFGFVSDQNGNPLYSVNKVTQKDTIQVQLRDGKLKCTVDVIQKEQEGSYE